jgi:hypothetical protein
MVKLSQLLRENGGTSVVELGMIAPILALFIVGIVDLAIAYSAKLSLEQAAQRSVEMAIGAGKVGSDYEYVRKEAASAANVPVENVTLATWLECGGSRQPDFYGVCEDSNDQIARYISVDIAGAYQPLFSLGAFGRQTDSAGRVPLRGDATVRLQ